MKLLGGNSGGELFQTLLFQNLRSFFCWKSNFQNHWRCGTIQLYFSSDNEELTFPASIISLLTCKSYIFPSFCGRCCLMLCVMTTARQVTAEKRRRASHSVVMIVFHVHMGRFQTRRVGPSYMVLWKIQSTTSFFFPLHHKFSTSRQNKDNYLISFFDLSHCKCKVWLWKMYCAVGRTNFLHIPPIIKETRFRLKLLHILFTSVPVNNLCEPCSWSCLQMLHSLWCRHLPWRRADDTVFFPFDHSNFDSSCRSP